MKKYLRALKNSSYRYLRGLTQEEAAKKSNTKKSNVANTEFKKPKIFYTPVTAYTKPLRFSQTETGGYTLGSLEEPSSPYLVSSPKGKMLSELLQQNSACQMRRSCNKISNQHKKTKYAIPPNFRVPLLPKISAAHLTVYANNARKKTYGVLSKKQKAMFLSLHRITKRKLPTNYLLWITNRSFPRLSIKNRQPVLIKIQPYYFASQLVLCSDATGFLFLGKILESWNTLVNLEDPQQTILSVTDSNIAIIGRLLIHTILF